MLASAQQTLKEPISRQPFTPFTLNQNSFF